MLFRSTYVVRLVRRGRVRYVNRGHAETQTVDGQVLTLATDLIDENRKGLHEWFERQNRYSSREAEHEQARAAALVAAADVDGQVVFESGKKPQPDAKSLFESLRLLNVVKFVTWIPGVSGWVSKRLAPAAGR